MKHLMIFSMVLTEQQDEFHTTVGVLNDTLPTKHVPLNVLFVRKKVRRSLLQ